MKSETPARLEPKRSSVAAAHIPAAAMAAALLVMGLSTVPTMAPLLPVLSLALFALAFIEFVIARAAGAADALHRDLMGALVLVGGAAAMLSESQHVLDVFGLAMPN